MLPELPFLMFLCALKASISALTFPLKVLQSLFENHIKNLLKFPRQNKLIKHIPKTEGEYFTHILIDQKIA